MVEPPPKPRRPVDELSDQTEAGDELSIDPREARGERLVDPSATLASRVRNRSDRARERVFARELARGETVGRYVILEKLGAGAMGIVHAAWDPDLDRKVALKLLHAERLGQRLLREAQAMARLSHPNVITVHDVGEVGEGAESRVFMAMEFVEGGTLAAWSRAQVREIPEILEVFSAAGRGLAAAHRSALVHRDFKPDNVMIGDDGRVRVMDFGLVRAASDDAARPSDDEDSALASQGGEHDPIATRDALTSASVLESRLTLEGALLGTPAYMAPEQLRGEPADARSDQFAFCIALWECLTGERPFAGDNPLAVLFAISQGELREPKRPVPGWLRRVIVRGLAANPDARWPDMPALLAALADDPRVRSRRWALGVGSLALSGLAAGLLVALWPEPPEVQPPCQAVDAPVHAVWSSDRAAALREAFAASSLTYADASATRVIGELDRWSAAWAAARIDACEATEVRREQSTDLLDRRMACLDQRLYGFTALVELFAGADATVIEKAVEAVEGLPRLEPCSDRAWLVAALRPPEDPALAEAVDAIERDTARVLARVEAGKAGDARELADATERSARALAWPAALADATFARGRVQQELGEFEAARGSLEQAYYTARLTNHDEVAAEASSLLVYTLAVGLGELELGGQWLRIAEVEAGRLDRPDLRADFESSAGIYWYMQDDLEAAAKAFAAQLAIEESEGAGLARRGQAQVNYGTVIERVDRRRYADEGIRATERGVGLLEQAYGPDHPQLGLALGNLATVYGDLERHDEAIVRLERALVILERAYGAEHPLTALTKLNLATNLTMGGLGQRERALELAEASLRVHEAVYGPSHTMTAESLRAIGRARHQVGQTSEAIAALDRAIAIGGARTDVTISSRLLRVTYLLELGRDAEAHAELDDITEHHADSPARIHHPRVLLRIAEAIVGQGGQRERVRQLLWAARFGIERRGEPQLLAWLGQLARINEA